MINELALRKKYVFVISLVYGSSSALRGVQLKIGESFKPPAKVCDQSMQKRVLVLKASL